MYSRQWYYPTVATYDKLATAANGLSYTLGWTYPELGTYYIAVVGAWDADSYDITLNMFESVLCSGTVVYTAPSGEITDGSGSVQYYPNMRCTFVVDPGNNPDNMVYLSFSAFDVEFEEQCIYDSVYFPCLQFWLRVPHCYFAHRCLFTWAIRLHRRCMASFVVPQCPRPCL